MYLVMDKAMAHTILGPGQRKRTCAPCHESMFIVLVPPNEMALIQLLYIGIMIIGKVVDREVGYVLHDNHAVPYRRHL